MKTMMTSIRAKPATLPPTIAPMRVIELDDEAVDSDAHDELFDDEIEYPELQKQDRVAGPV